MPGADERLAFPGRQGRHAQGLRDLVDCLGRASRQRLAAADAGSRPDGSCARSGISASTSATQRSRTSSARPYRRRRPSSSVAWRRPPECGRRSISPSSGRRCCKNLPQLPGAWSGSVFLQDPCWVAIFSSSARCRDINSLNISGPIPKARSTRRASPLIPGWSWKALACFFRRARIASKTLIVA